MSEEYFYIGEYHNIDSQTFKKFIVRVYKAQTSDNYRLIFINNEDQKIVDTVQMDGPLYDVYIRSLL